MNHIGREAIITVGGTQYKLSRLDRALYFKFIDWAKGRLGDPLADLRGKLDGFPNHIQELLVKEAIAKSKERASVSCQDYTDLLQTEAGLLKIISLLLQKHQPHLTDEQAGEIFDRCCEEHGTEYLVNAIQTAQGTVRLPKTEEKKG